MTRYARAKGSKASNERLPNEATPWHLMKQQFEKNKVILEKEKIKELSQNQKRIFYSDTIGNVNHNWAEFDDNEFKCNTKKPKNSKSKEKYTSFTENSGISDTINITASKCNNTEKLQKTQDAKIVKTNLEKNKFSNNKQIEESQLDSTQKEFKTFQQSGTSLNFVALSKRQKRNRKRKLNTSNDESKRFKENTSDKTVYDKLKSQKIKEKKEYKRRKPDNNNITKIIIDDIEIKIVKFDGFPVKKEDAERLMELKQKLIMKGVPKSEVDLTLKLERRKAEKALARAKKLVCFNCRISGHTLSSCPEIDKQDAGTGICFKCGSTEHTHFECKVSSSYRFAKCFICREQGHIAAQCPDNPKGIYPQGGCCKICGAITHLKKDCPDLVKVKEDNAVTVEKMDDLTVESLQKDVKSQKESNEKSKHKIIKF